LNILVIRHNCCGNLLRWSSWLTFFFAAHLALALNPAKSVYQYNCRSWVRQNGLPANGVYAIRQTADGYLWLGTSRGLVRFDGEEFKLFDMTHTPGIRSTIITSIANSRNGGLWFGLERGSFGHFDGHEFTLFGRDEWGGRSLLVQSVLETQNGEVWIAAERLAARLAQTNHWEPVLADAGSARYDVTAMCQDSRGRVWLGTSQRGVYYWQNGVLTKFPDPKLDEFNIRSLVEDQKGQIWIGTEWGLFRYDTNFQKQPFPHPWYETKALLVDREGVVWAGTSGGGLCRILNDTNLVQLRKADGLSDDFVSALIEDQEGSLWVGTRNGLSQISDVKIPTFGKSEGLTADVNVGLFPSQQGGLWVATGKGFTYFDGSAHPSPASAGLRNSYVMQVLEARNGDLYVVTGAKDVEIVSDGNVVARHPNHNWPSAMAEDDRGVVMAVGGELYRVDTNSCARYEFKDGRAPPIHWVDAMITARDGSIWIAADVGICHLSQGTFRLWSQAEGLPNSKVLWVCEDDDGIIWAGLETGMARLKDGRIRLITRENGLFDNINRTIIADDHGSLWVDSSRGFYSVSRQSLNEFAEGKTDRVDCVGYDGLDAIKSSEKYQQQRSGCRTADGRIWFPTAQGIVMIDPTNITANPVPPNVHIHQVRAGGRELGRADDVILPPGEGNLEFHYAGLSYIAPLKIQYRYRLEGYEKDWVDAGTRRAAFYTNLKPGRYAFQVQACNEDGVWSTRSAYFAVELKPHYYQTTWFYLLSGLLVCAGLAGVYQWRVRWFRQKQAALQHARDLLEAKVAERTAALARSNLSLIGEVEERVKAQTELESRKATLEKEIEERKRMELEVERVHRQLVDASRLAGQAEVASSVLHNVGNVLNSINVSTSLVNERLENMPLGNLAKAAHLLHEHAADLGSFLSTHEKGRRLPAYLEQLAEHLGREQREVMAELKELTGNVEHIKEIVAMQQSYTRAFGMVEQVAISDLVDSVLRMSEGAYRRDAIQVVRDYDAVPAVLADKHKLLQILVNVIQNARNACEDRGRPDKTVTVRIKRSGRDRIFVAVTDNGVGIAPENLTRIFAHGFTTRKAGHGFGLHSAALAAKQMGGTLTARSEGLGQGATFYLELPLHPTAEQPMEIPTAAADESLTGDTSP
jgi:ligand-binding sensor domain-containing protein/C4-dicarboxylate-specific signal transduction histidine kinase